MKKIILVGASLELIDYLRSLSFDVIGIIDKNKNGEYHGYPILGDDEWLVNNAGNVCTKNLVIPFDDGKLKKRLSNLYSENGFHFPRIFSEPPKSQTHFGIGTIIQQCVHISTNCSIGDFVKVNVCANVMHDVVLCNYCTIAPNALILGNAKVGEGAMIGANATILPHVVIGSYAMVGAGAVVTKDVQENSVVKGIPAK